MKNWIKARELNEIIGMFLYFFAKEWKPCTMVLFWAIIKRRKEELQWLFNYTVSLNLAYFNGILFYRETTELGLSISFDREKSTKREDRMKRNSLTNKLKGYTGVNVIITPILKLLGARIILDRGWLFDLTLRSSRANSTNWGVCSVGLSVKRLEKRNKP